MRTERTAIFFKLSEQMTTRIAQTTRAKFADHVFNRLERPGPNLR